MSIRVLGIELRRTVGLTIGAILVVITLGLLLLVSGPWGKGLTAWTTQWNAMAVWHRQLLAFLWPLALGAGTLQGLREGRTRIAELLATTARPTWQRVAYSAGAMAVGLIGSYLVVIAVGAVQVAGNTSYFTLGWVPVAAVGMLSLVAAGWLGMGVGRLLPSKITPPVVAVAGGVALIALQLRSVPETTTGYSPISMLSPDTGAVRDVFSTVPVTLSLGQAVWFGGMAVAGLVLLMANRVRARALALVPLVLGALVALPLLPATADAVYTNDPGAGALVCADGAPRVCVIRAHAGMLATLVGPARQALALLAKLPNAPTSVVEDSATGSHPPPPPADLAVISFEDLDFLPPQDTSLSADQLRLGILAGAGTRSCTERKTPHVFSFDPRNRAARTVAASWLVGRYQPLREFSSDHDEINALAKPVWQELRGLPAAEQRQRVATMRAASLACRGDLLDVLQ